MNPESQPPVSQPPVTQPPIPEQQPSAPAQQFQATQPVAAQPSPEVVDKGKTTAIGGIILGIVLGAPFGLAASIVAMNQSKQVGRKNTLALVFTILFAIGTPFWFIAIVQLFTSIG